MLTVIKLTMFQRVWLISTDYGFYLMHCFSNSLVVIHRYHHFNQRAANHCCPSLTPHALIVP